MERIPVTLGRVRSEDKRIRLQRPLPTVLGTLQDFFQQDGLLDPTWLTQQFEQILSGVS